MQACVQRHASNGVAQSHQICLAPSFGGISAAYPLCCPILVVARIGGLHWWADSPMQFHSWVTQSFRARPISQPTRVESHSSFAEGVTASAEPRGPI